MSDFKGVWIPAEVWQIEDLLLIEKVFLCQIQSLCNDDGCFASNSYFAKFFGVSNSRCTQIIKKLEEQKYISVELERKGKMVSKRVVTTLNKCSELFKHGSKYIKEGSKSVKHGSKQIKEGCLIDSEYNNTEVNNTFNNKEEESKKENIPSIEIESLIPDFEKLKADYSNLQTELKKEKEKSSAKKESSVLPKNGITQIDISKLTPLEELKLILNGDLTRVTQLDKNFHFGLFGKEWSENFQNEVIAYFRYMESKKSGRWGVIGTLSSQIDAFKSYLNQYSENEIIAALKETRLNGTVSYNPQWTIDRNKKADYSQPTQPKKTSNLNSIMLEGDLDHKNLWHKQTK